MFDDLTLPGTPGGRGDLYRGVDRLDGVVLHIHALQQLVKRRVKHNVGGARLRNAAGMVRHPVSAGAIAINPIANACLILIGTNFEYIRPDGGIRAASSREPWKAMFLYTLWMTQSSRTLRGVCRKRRHCCGFRVKRLVEGSDLLMHLVLLLSLTIGLDLLGVLLQCGGKTAVASGVADEVEEVGVGGRDGRAQSCEARVADRAWWQPGVPVSVVGRGGLQVRGMDDASPAAVEQRRVDDRGVGGKGHALGKAIDENPCDERPLRILANLFFDQRRHRDGSRDVAGHAQRCGGLAEAVDHSSEHLHRCCVAGEVVSVWKEVAFEGGGMLTGGGPWRDQLGVLTRGGEEGSARTETGGLDSLRDVEELKPSGTVRVRV